MRPLAVKPRMEPIVMESRVKTMAVKPSVKSPKMKCRVKTTIRKPRMESLEKISWMMRVTMVESRMTKTPVVKSRVAMKTGAPVAEA